MRSRSSRGRRRKGQLGDGAWDMDMMAVEVDAFLANTGGQLLKGNMGSTSGSVEKCEEFSDTLSLPTLE